MDWSRESFGDFLHGKYGLGSTTRGGGLKFGEDRKRLRTSVENFVDLLANGSLPWAAYRAFMSGHLIGLEKQPSV